MHHYPRLTVRKSDAPAEGHSRSRSSLGCLRTPPARSTHSTHLSRTSPVRALRGISSFRRRRRPWARIRSPDGSFSAWPQPLVRPKRRALWAASRSTSQPERARANEDAPCPYPDSLASSQGGRVMQPSLIAAIGRVLCVTLGRKKERVRAISGVGDCTAAMVASPHHN